MKKSGRKIIALCWALFALSIHQAFATPPEIAEFTFNHSAAVMHARAAIEDFGTLMMKEQPLSEYDFSKPYTAAVMSRDCSSKQPILAVLVAFPKRSGEGWAVSRWERNKDGLISRLLSAGFSVETLDALIHEARTGGPMCE
ncbi:MAG: hypothetical protein AB9917_21550 [Negativicutes bacterium]